MLRTHRGPFVSDHSAVIAQLNAKQLNPKQQCRLVRKVKEVSTEQWIKAYEDKDLHLSDDLDHMVKSLDDALGFTLNDLAPEKQVTIPLKPKQPWYTKDLRILKCKIR